jgi:hypothetical protein
MRDVYAHTWLRHLIEKAKSCQWGLIADLRYSNEVLAIQQANGICVRVHDPRKPIFNDVADSNLIDFNEWDFVIINDGSLHDLHKKCVKLMSIVGESPTLRQNTEITL